MSTKTECPEHVLVDAHFARTISTDDEARLRAHLPTCDACHRRYGRRLVLARLDPEAPAPKDRIARGLGMAAQPAKPSRPKWTVIAGGMTAALGMAAAMLLVLRSLPTGDARHEGFTARGGGAELDASSAIRVYHGPKGGLPVPAVGSIRPDDEVAFSYENRTGKRRLMIFGVDEHGHVFWYHPAWQSAATDPRAIAIRTDGTRHELGEAVVHALDGAVLEIHALFLEHDATVKEVERTLGGRAAPLGPVAMPGAIDEVIRLEVSR